MMSRRPDRLTSEWFERQDARSLVLAAMTVAELRFGVDRLPQGARRERLASALDDVLRRFGGRILPYDLDVAERHGRLRVVSEKAGRDHEAFDLVIAATALVHGTAVATRNVRDFDYIPGLALVNPWDAA